MYYYGVSRNIVMPQTLNSSPHAHRHQKEIEVLASISKILAEQSGQEKMLSEVLSGLERTLGFSNCISMLLSVDGSKLIVEATRKGQATKHPDLSYLKGEGITGTVVQTGRPAIVPRISREPRFRNMVYQRPLGDGNDVGFVCVPVVVGNEVVGTLSADVPQETVGELDEHARLLDIVAGLIAFDMKSRRMAQLDRRNLEAENLRLRSELKERIRPENIIGNSTAMRNVYQRICQVAPSDTTVLIRGESGTGKELVAAATHFGSRRSKGPFVRVNCAALNESLLESELFGHEKGAFTGALAMRVGRIEEAEGGTLFLDEIGDFSPSIQVKLLRVLQEREYQRVGSNKTVKADVRIIAATNKDLEASVKNGEFRQDFYYRIHVFPISLPPLRERKNDILLLADHFVQKYAKRMHKDIRRISTQAINMMFAYHWPGNVRELENCIEHATLLSTNGVLHGHNLPPTLQMPGTDRESQVGSLPERVHMLEKDMMIDALKSTRGNVAAAARRLGISARMARYKIRNLNIEVKRFSNANVCHD